MRSFSDVSSRCSLTQPTKKVSVYVFVYVSLSSATIVCIHVEGVVCVSTGLYACIHESRAR